MKPAEDCFIGGHGAGFEPARRLAVQRMAADLLLHLHLSLRQSVLLGLQRVQVLQIGLFHADAHVRYCHDPMDFHHGLDRGVARVLGKGHDPKNQVAIDHLTVRFDTLRGVDWYDLHFRHPFVSTLSGALGWWCLV